MRKRIALLAAAGLGAAAAPATAAEVTRTTVCADSRCSALETFVRYEAAPGEVNDLVVDFVYGRVTFRDRVPITAPRACRRRSELEVTCPTDSLMVMLGDGDDRSATTTDASRWFTVDGGAGNDRLASSDGAGLLGGDGDDELAGVDLLGGAGRDTLVAAGGERAYLSGGPGEDVLRGGPGDDHLEGDDHEPPAADVIDGGGGSDSVSYSAHGVPVRIDLQAGIAGAAGEGDRLSGIEHATGGRRADVLIGDAGANLLEGRGGRNTISGGAGDDRLDTWGGGTQDGGPGNDVLSGGPGRNRLSGGPGADTLYGAYGRDVLAGGSGDDRMLMHVTGRRGERGERASCGTGRDTVLRPGRALILPGCELADRLPAYPRALPGRRLVFTLPRAGRFRGGRIELRLLGCRRPNASG